MSSGFYNSYKHFGLFFCLYAMVAVVVARPTDKDKPTPPKQTLRIELPRNSFDYAHSILPLPDSALLVITKKREVEVGKNEIILTKYNHILKPVWETKAPQPNGSKLIFKENEQGRAYLLFKTSISDTKLLLYQIDTYTGSFILSEHFLHSPYATVREMKVLEGQVFLSALDKEGLSMLHLNPKESEIRILPAVMGKAKNLGEFRVDTLNKTLELSVLETKGTNTRLLTRFVSAQGDMMGGYYLQPKELPTPNQLLRPARLTPGPASQKLFLGSYSYDVDEFAQGLYSINLQGEMKYYDFGKLSHFYEYRSSPATSLRMKARALRKEAKGNAPIKQYRMFFHHVLPHPQGYALIGELFEPTTQFEPTNQVEYGHSGTSIRSGFMQLSFHAFVCVFDPYGTLLWDNSFKLTHNKKLVPTFEATNSPIIHKAISPGGNVIMAYMKNSEIFYKTLQPKSSTSDRIPVQLPKDSDKRVTSSQEGIQHWYGTNFIAYGFQRISSKKEPSRTVFYLQQVAFE